MNKLLLLLILPLLVFAGCALNAPLVKQQKLQQQKLAVATQLAYQADRTTNAATQRVYTEKLMNLLGQPPLKSLGETNLDSKIIAIQKAELRNDADIQQLAEQAQSLQSQVNSYKSYWGLGAVALGLKELVKHVLWYGLGFIVVYIVLRALAFTNPIANLIFGIFQSIAASLIHLVEIIVPQSISVITQAQSDVKTVSNAVDTVVVTKK